MTRVLRRVAATAAAAAVLLAVAACDPGDDLTDPPTESSDETTSEDVTTDEVTTEPATDVPTPPEVEAPTPDPGASVDDHQGAILAAEYFMALYGYMRQSGDTSSFESMSSPDCKFCVDSVGDVVELHDAGGWAEGGEVTFERSAATATYPTAEEPNYLVRFSATEAPSVTHLGDGTTESRDGGTLDAVVALQFVDGRFITSGVNTE